MVNRYPLLGLTSSKINPRSLDLEIISGIFLTFPCPRTSDDGKLRAINYF